MKYMVISDIHGGITELNKVLDIYAKERCSKLLILGDLFNYVFDLNRDDIINRLNLMKENIVAVCGNCDNNIRDIIFDMPYINTINLNNKSVTLTHGHLFDRKYLSELNTDIILFGHSHIPEIEFLNDKIFINPGSITKSRKGENSFVIIDENQISIRDLDNNIIETQIIELKNKI